MMTWYSVLLNNSIVLVINIQIVIGNYILSKLIYFIDSDVDKLSKIEEVACNTLMVFIQVFVKMQQYHEIKDLNVSVMLWSKAI